MALRISTDILSHKSTYSFLKMLYVIFLPALLIAPLLYLYFSPPNPNPVYPAEPDTVSMMYSAFWSITLIHSVTPLWLLDSFSSQNIVGSEFRLHPGWLQLAFFLIAVWNWKRLPLSASAKRFLFLLMVAFFIIALGPFIQVFDRPVRIFGLAVPAPAMLFEIIPGLTSMRVYARFVFVVWLAVSLLGLIWIQHAVLAKSKNLLQYGIIGVVLGLFLVETEWRLPKMHFLPETHSLYQNVHGPLLELPIEPTRLSGAHLYHQTLHRQPVYAIEISRLSQYKSAYLAAHPILIQTSDYVKGERFSVEDESRLFKQLCPEFRRLNIQNVKITGIVTQQEFIKDRHDQLLNRIQNCHSNETP